MNIIHLRFGKELIMKYNFLTLTDRFGHDALAVDALGTGWAPGLPKEGFSVLPMWIADMGFPVAPFIQDAMRKRLEHPSFGYFSARKEYFDAIIRWQYEQNGSHVEADNIGYENGVLGGVVSALNAFEPKNKRVLLHSPTYIGFTSALTSAGYEIVHSPLKLDDNGVWRMDFDDMEDKIKTYDITSCVFCSPHNPSGRVWEEWELDGAMQIFEKYKLGVVSDEIWSDIILNGHKHIPLQSVSDYAREHTAAMYAPSKSFSLAGLVGSYHIVYNEQLHEKIKQESAKSHYNSMNVLSMYALLGAYTEDGKEWLHQLNCVLTENAKFAYKYIFTNFEGISCAMPEGTYMLFVNCKDWLNSHGKTVDELLRACWDVGVALQDGRPFHGEHHLRINLALPTASVKEAFERLDRYVFNA